MRELLDRRSPEVQRRCDDQAMARARRIGGEILHIVWDDPGVYPEFSLGYEQWSARPFYPGHGCDGTTDPNIHFIALQMCKRLGLDYCELYEQAYDHKQSWLRFYDWQGVAEETYVPEVSDAALRTLLYDLGQINNTSILAVLRDKFEAKGYDVDEWWRRRRRLALTDMLEDHRCRCCVPDGKIADPGTFKG